MKHKIKIPETQKVGGFDILIDTSAEAHQALIAQHRWGDWSLYGKRIRLQVDTEVGGQELSSTFIHEITEAVNTIYCNSRLSEDDITGISNGWHQVLESLGIRFIR